MSRPCNVCELLTDLVGAVEPLAQKQQRSVRLCELSRPLQVAIEEPALRQALSNLIEGALLRAQIGGKVEIVSTEAPAGGALVIIDDDGPDMHYMVSNSSLCKFSIIESFSSYPKETESFFCHLPWLFFLANNSLMLSVSACC